MHPKSPVASITVDGDAICHARKDIIQMCTNFEITSLLSAAKNEEYDGLLHLVEDHGSLGLSRWDNVKLAEHWADIRDEYYLLLDAGKLVFDHQDPEVVPASPWPEHILKIQGLNDAEIEIVRNGLIERLAITAVAEAINSWDDHEDTDFISYTKLEGCTGFNNMSDEELIAEWDDCRNSFYLKASTGNLKSDIPNTDPEKDAIQVFPWLPLAGQP